MEMTVYLFTSDLADHAGLAEEFRNFTDVRPSRPPLAERQVVVVSFTGDAVDAIGRMTRRRRKAVNLKWGVKLDELVLLEEPLPLDELLAALPPDVASRVESARVPPGVQLGGPAATTFLDTIAALRPELSHDIDHLRLISSPLRRRRWRPDREPIVHYERDAVGLALDMAGMRDERESVLSAWDGRTDEPFVESIAHYTVLEDRAIEHDARVFGNWPLIKSGAVGMTRFESRGRRVTIINVNRAGIENAVGVDLIYYTQQYNAYVLVQYKRRQEGGSGERWVFRPDSQFDKQLERMRGLIEDDSEPEFPHEYRLDQRCCFLKICSPTTPDAFSPDLINGVYLPLAYWECLTASGALTGPRGGRVLTDKTVGRHLTNTLFIELVKASWVGSRKATWSQITQVLEAGLAENESFILANASTDSPAALDVDGLTDGPEPDAGDAHPLENDPF